MRRRFIESTQRLWKRRLRRQASFLKVKVRCSVIVADDHTRSVFDPGIRGVTDQVVLRFRRPD